MFVVTTTKLERLQTLVAEAYLNVSESSDPWQRWCYRNHVLVVAEHCRKLSTTYSGNTEECIAGALLHDIADSTLDREHPEHEIQSRQLATEFLHRSGYDKEQTNRILEEVIAPHSCRVLMPQTIDGKILATADAITHLTTNFYSYCAWHRIAETDYSSFKKWASGKLDRDLNAKIFFEEIRDEMKPIYLALKSVFSD